MLTVVASRYADLSRERRAQLEAIAHSEFGGVPIVRETAWAVPGWSLLGLDGTDLACFYNIVERVARFDGTATPVAGLNNLITLPTYRGRGLASRLLRYTEPIWFRTLGARYGLLLCADELLPFYSRLGWQRVAAPVRFSQPDGQHTWAANCMVLAPSRGEIRPCEVDSAACHGRGRARP